MICRIFCILFGLCAVICSIQVIDAGILERGERLQLPIDQNFSGNYWLIELKKRFFNKIVATDCVGVLLEFATTKESQFSDTILMPAFCFASEFTKPEHYYITGVEELAIAFSEYDSNSDKTGRTVLYNISSITINLKYSVPSTEYNLAIIKLKTPAHPFRGVVISSFPLTEVANCSVAGLMAEFDFPITSQVGVYYHGYPTFINTIVNLPELKTVDGNRTIVSEVPSLPNNTIFLTDSSNTLVCTKNDQPFMQGVIKDTQDRTIYFHNIAAFHEWIVNPAKPSSINEVAFHDKLAEFESNFRHNDSLKNGSAVKDWYYAKEWQINSLSEKIYVKTNLISFDHLHDSTREENSYNCAITCYLKNKGNPCSYAIPTKECLFSSVIVEPTLISSEVITIYF